MAEGLRGTDVRAISRLRACRVCSDSQLMTHEVRQVASLVASIGAPRRFSFVVTALGWVVSQERRPAATSPGPTIRLMVEADWKVVADSSAYKATIKE
jgi:hypothetical protein